MTEPDIYELARQWLALDQNKRTRAEIEDLLSQNNAEELEKRLRNRIVFGTAGLRAKMQAGYSYMNDVTVSQASLGFGTYLLEKYGKQQCRERGIVVGHDHRHNSKRFARLAAAQFVTQGINVHFFDKLVHTPIVPFAVGYLKALGGVMVTASHNPAQDNGYKVLEFTRRNYLYWSNGCQIIPPHDSGIAAAILKNELPICWDVTLVDSDSNSLITKYQTEIEDAYIKALYLISRDISPEALKEFKFVYTPMHGVGLAAMRRVIKSIGLEEDLHMYVAPEQAQPDPDFTTVRFPNPEEHGALNLAITFAICHSCPIVIASDPDADRFAAAVSLKYPPTLTSWRILTGNELGILFAHYIFSNYPENKEKSKLAMLASTVSSQMLSHMARTEGFHYRETLTGFKWLGNVAQQLEKEGYDVPYAFEEAIGYMYSKTGVYDKDGIAAAAVWISFITDLHVKNKTPLDVLEELSTKYGYFESFNTYFISPSPEVTTKVFSQIRALGNPYPITLGKKKITRWRDLTTGYDSATPDHVPDLPTDKSSQMITVELDDGEVRFTIRGSGTEPKIKAYIECRALTREDAKRGAEEVYRELVKSWFKPEENKLQPQERVHNPQEAIMIQVFG